MVFSIAGGQGRAGQLISGSATGRYEYGTQWIAALLVIRDERLSACYMPACTWGMS